MEFDVAIIGGGPGGSTCGSFLRKYNPRLKVGIFEREVFPREHVGESQLPVIGAILDELGVWDRIEAADFPVKIGATYRWGNSDDLWDFHFLPNGEFVEEPRPAKFQGQRLETAFQVDRGVYDKILLDFAKESGVDVMENTAVRTVKKMGDHVDGLILEDGTEVTARYYIDASGHAGLLRRAMGVEIEEPSSLKNVAFWDYWQNTEWAVTLGVGGTRIQVMSVGYGWLWFIPISPTRTSCGFVCPADYYKKSGLTPEQLYLKAIEEEPRIKGFVKNATREHNFKTTKDWSFVAKRMTGENWMLVGEALGFADPILSAGLSMTHMSAREAAHIILEMDRGGTDKHWMLEQYFGYNRRRVLQHIQFADYWYAANEHFSDLKEFTRDIAKGSGLELDAENAFQWLGTGGFIEEQMGLGGIASFSFNAVHQIVNRLSKDPGKKAFAGYNRFVPNFQGATKINVPHYEEGRVYAISAYSRDGKVLPLSGLIGWLFKGLESSTKISEAFKFVLLGLRKEGIQYDRGVHEGLLQCLEGAIRDGWITPTRDGSGDWLPDVMPESPFFQPNRDEALPVGTRAASGDPKSKTNSTP
jgi:flavin-dependent dehydrogenase